MYGCKSNCVFEKESSPGSRFCFKEGDLEVVCDGDGASGEQNVVHGMVRLVGRLVEVLCGLMWFGMMWYGMVWLGPHEQVCKENDQQVIIYK